VNWNNSEGEVSGDLGLRLTFMIIDNAKNTGVAYAPPGIISIRIPMIAGIHHVFEVWDVWAWVCFLSGIQV